jgi:hypothetical protein
MWLGEHVKAAQLPRWYVSGKVRFFAAALDPAVGSARSYMMMPPRKSLQTQEGIVTPS